MAKIEKVAEVSPLMQAVSAYIASALKRKLPQEVAARAKNHLVDTFAAILSGSKLLPGRRVIAYVKPLGGVREAGVIGTRHVTSVVNAALANGTCGHADETDDTHPPTRTHPGTSVIPAALAVAEKHALTGQQFMRAMVLGYDMCARTLLALNPRKLVPTGRHAGATGQVFGAMAAAAALIKLNPRQVRHALSYTLQQTAGVTTMFRDTEHIEKAYAMGGMPAHNGVQAALMVASGFTGVEDIYAGDPDFFSIFSPEGDRTALAKGLGQTYEIMRGGIKRWSVGGPIQGPMHVLYELMTAHGIKANDVEQLVVGMPEEQLSVVNDREMPDISLQHMLAVMLVDKTVSFRAAHDKARMQDPAILRQRAKIHLVPDEELEKLYPKRVTVMEVELTDGTRLSERVEAVRGTAENPMTRDEVVAKARDLLSQFFSAGQCSALIEAVLKLDSNPDIRSLRPLLQRA